MSHSPKKPESGVTGLDNLNDRFKETVTVEANKPDFRELDLGSPVSPLRTRGPAASSSSGSSGSFSGGRNNQNRVEKRSDSKPNNSNSGELSGSCENSPTRSGGNVRGSKPGHKRSDSGSGSGSGPSPLIYSGQSVTSPALNVLPTGNICPSGRIVKTGMVANKSSRSDVLGTGTGNYGHGSIMRGGVSPAKVESSQSLRSGIGSDSGRRVSQSVDPEELKRIANEHYKKGHFADAVSLYDRAIALSPASPSYRSNRAAALTGLGRLSEAIMDCVEAVRLDPNYARAHNRLASLFIR